MKKNIFIVDDEISNLIPLEKILLKEGFNVKSFNNPQTCLEEIRLNPPHLIISDMRMPGINGLNLLKSSKLISPSTRFILVTAYGTIENAVTAMKDEATDFLSKPIQREKLLSSVNKALHEQEMLEQNINIRTDSKKSIRSLLGRSKEFQELMEKTERAASSNATILITGETGTSKTRLAKEIHNMSSRKKIIVNKNFPLVRFLS